MVSLTLLATAAFPTKPRGCAAVSIEEQLGTAGSRWWL
jgi:hypothetical protein